MIIIGTISPALYNFEETLSTLRFISRINTIFSTPRKNTNKTIKKTFNSFISKSETIEKERLNEKKDKADISLKSTSKILENRLVISEEYYYYYYKNKRKFYFIKLFVKNF